MAGAPRDFGEQSQTVRPHQLREDRVWWPSLLVSLPHALSAVLRQGGLAKLGPVAARGGTVRQTYMAVGCPQPRSSGVSHGGILPCPIRSRGVGSIGNSNGISALAPWQRTLGAFRQDGVGKDA